MTETSTAKETEETKDCKETLLNKESFWSGRDKYAETPISLLTKNFARDTQM